jgi:hypothetical protein
MRFSLVILLLFNISCASTYHIEIAPKYEELIQFRDSSSVGAPQPTYSESKIKGPGLSIGLIETTSFLFAKANYSVVSYERTYTYSSPVGGGTSSYSERDIYTQFDLALGFKLGFLKPYIVTSSIKESEATDIENFAGYGARIEIPIGETTKISLDYSHKQRFYEDETYNGPRDKINSAYIGIMFGGWQFGRINKKKGRGR